MASAQEVLPRESGARRLSRAGLRIFVTTFDVGFLVLATSLLGLALAVLLDGFEIADTEIVTSVGEALGSALVIAVLGAFALGVAVEGPLYRGEEGLSISYLEQAVLRASCLLVVGSGLVLLGRLLDQFTADLPAPFEVVTTFVVTVGFAGLTATVVLGPAAVWAIQRLAPPGLWIELEWPTLYVVWALSTAFIFML